jgi:hypothetical protein
MYFGKVFGQNFTSAAKKAFSISTTTSWQSSKTQIQRAIVFIAGGFAATGIATRQNAAARKRSVKWSSMRLTAVVRVGTQLAAVTSEFMPPYSDVLSLCAGMISRQSA